MDMNDYLDAAQTTAIFPTADSLSYLTMGLVGEAGEIANQVKKVYRDDDRILSTQRQEKIVDELGDVLWYLAMLADLVCDSGLSGVARHNLAKLADRQRTGRLQGDRRETLNTTYNVSGPGPDD